jgi:hypothetical protein
LINDHALCVTYIVTDDADTATLPHTIDKFVQDLRSVSLQTYSHFDLVQFVLAQGEQTEGKLIYYVLIMNGNN